MISPYKKSAFETRTGLFSSTQIPSTSRLQDQTIILKPKSSRKEKDKQNKIKQKFIAKINFKINKQSYQPCRIKTQSSSSHYDEELVAILRNNMNLQKCNKLIKEMEITKSTQQLETIQSYSVGTVKGLNIIVNTNQISIFMGSIKHIMLIEGYQGIFAANYIKKQLPLQLLAQLHQNSQNYYSEDIGTTIASIYTTIQKKLNQEQKQRRDRSGCSSISVIVTQDTIYVANCGVSHVYCYTKSESLKKMNNCHDTKNPQQLERVANCGGKLYRTTVNLAFKKQLDIIGPIRIYPTGGTITRTLGFPTNLHEQIISVPQTFYIHKNDVKWVIVLSSSLMQLILIQTIQQIVNRQIKNKSISYTLHDIAEIISQKILTMAIKQGIKKPATVILLLIGVKQCIGLETSFPRENNLKEPQRVPNKHNYSSRNNHLLGYAGIRKSLFKDTFGKK